MTTIEQWRELEALLVNATGPSREIDNLFYNLARWKKPPSNGFVSGSIDAALAFADGLGFDPFKVITWVVLDHSTISLSSFAIAILRAVCAAKVKELENGKA